MRNLIGLATRFKEIGIGLTICLFLCAATSGVESDATSGKAPVGTEAKNATVEVARRIRAGHPLASGMMKLVEREIVDQMERRGTTSHFERFCQFAAMKLDTTASEYTGSEVTGNCRLSWYDHLLRTPTTAAGEAEEFTRTLQEHLSADHHGLGLALALARKRMDLPASPQEAWISPTSPEEALVVLGEGLAGAQAGYARAISTLSRGEIAEMQRNLYPILVSQNRLGHTLQSRTAGRRLCDQMEQMDRAGFYDAVESLLPVSDPALLEQLGLLVAVEEMTEGESEGTEAPELRSPGVTGLVVRRVLTSGGTIVVGGAGANTYDLDAMMDVSAVIDLGGDDTYREGIVSHDRPVLVLIDLSGDDTYTGKRPGIQGSAILGISLLLDVSGSDTYRGQDVAQASALAGAGVLIDYAGNDTYLGLRRVQGQAFGGLGLLIDRAGDDKYHGALWTQGMGGPLGFAVLEDQAGADHYYTGGLYPDDYDETPGYEGWGQGVGAGPRQVANGGIGVILDGAGDDVYEFDYLSHGGGYWMGLGFARDFGGNDQRLGATRKTYQGGQRYEQRFQRFGMGFGCHYALGYCFDDEGDDSYHGTIMGVGHAWDCSVAGLFDFAGKDRYEATGNLTQGSGAQAGMAVLFDYDGDDHYSGYSQGHAPASITYHSLPRCGGNFGFVIDYGGDDTYGCRARNNAFTQRGSSGGFIVDRPKRKKESDNTPTT